MRFGMDFGGTNLKAGIYQNNGETIAFKEQKLLNFTDNGDLLSNILQFSKNFIGNHKLQCGGFAIKGLVDTNNGILMEDIGAGDMLAGKKLQKIFEDELNIPFVIDNDSRAYMFGEWQFGAGRNSNSLVCMTLGTGFGCSVIANGKPYYGSDALGGLLGGHISIDRNGPICSCGQKGCLEMYCSATALNMRIKQTFDQFKDFDDALSDFFKLVKAGNKFALEINSSFIDDLSVGVVNAIHAFNPELIILGGGVMNSSELIIPELTKLVHQRAWTYPRNKVQIKVAELGNKAATMGIAFHPVFNQ